ncbi:MAG: gamma-glutamyltransferase [Acidobacteria bacterium]|nr:gamma-glutamyltransferase [Acidobacteriota bacterium]
MAGWEALSSRFGKKPWKELLQPAIEYAREGYAASPIIAHSWNLLADKLRRFPTTRESFLFEGQAPRVGQIVDFIQSQGGPLSLSDLREYRPEWVDPISTDYRGYRVCELPPNGQGIAALQMLNLLEGFDLRSMKHNGADYLHLLIEAKKLAFADLYAYVADPSRASVPVEGLLSKDYAAKRRGRIDPRRAATRVEPGLPVAGDTIYLTVADAEGNMVSFINSLFHGFGSGVVAAKTGIVL